MGIFLRKLWQNKPKQYGPWKFVHRSLFHNAERMGINPADIALAMPMWNPGDQIDYSKNGVFTIGSGVSFINNNIITDATINGTIDLGTSFNYSTETFTIIQSCKVNTIDSFSISNRSSPTAKGYEFLIGNASTQGTVQLRLRGTSYSQSALGTGYNDGKHHQIAANIDPLSLSSFYIDDVMIDSTIAAPGAITGSQNLYIDRRGTTYRAGEHDFLLIFSAIIDKEILFFLSENPYQPWQPYSPPVYFDQAQGSSLLPISGNMPAMAGTLTKKASFHRSLTGEI